MRQLKEQSQIEQRRRQDLEALWIQERLVQEQVDRRQQEEEAARRMQEERIRQLQQQQREEEERWLQQQ